MVLWDIEKIVEHGDTLILALLQHLEEKNFKIRALETELAEARKQLQNGGSHE